MNNSSNDETSRREFIIFTRRRWDRLFSFSFVAFSAVGVFLSFHESCVPGEILVVVAI